MSVPEIEGSEEDKFTAALDGVGIDSYLEAADDLIDAHITGGELEVLAVLLAKMRLGEQP